MGNGVGVVVRALRARQGEIERAVFARVREAVPDHAGDADSEYVRGLRAAVAAAVEYCFAGLERGDRLSAEIPAQAVAQAQRAARSGVSLDAVLRRYIVGNALVCDYIMQECDAVHPRGRVSGRELLRAQAAQLDRLVIGVTREHVAELQRAGRSREQRLLERVRMLLAGEELEEGGTAPGAVDPDLDYDLGGEHLGVIAWGAAREQALCDLARVLHGRLLCVPASEGVAWAWLAVGCSFTMADLERVAGGGVRKEEAQLAVGEPARGLAGWRLTHRQAQAAMAVAARRPRALTRYGDVALLATALKDDALSRTLIDVYIAPLIDARGSGGVLLQSLRAYLLAERSVSSAAAALGVARKTVEKRLRSIEERLGRTLHPCPPELEVALLLHELSSTPKSSEVPIVG
jgi:PucR C-terminal helix-turn-helix domain